MLGGLLMEGISGEERDASVRGALGHVTADALCIIFGTCVKP